jgi:glycosyltransferase involved in cell wall biosynthesis
MTGHRALVVAYDFPPHAAIGTQRTLRFVRHLDGEGWPTAVLTGQRSTFRKGTPVDEALLDRVPAGVDVVRTTVLRPFEKLDQFLRGTPGAGPTRPSRPKGGSSGPTTTAGPKAHSSVQRFKSWLNAITTVPDAEVGWLLPSVLQGVRFARRWKPDVVYSSAPPWTGHLAGGIIAQLTGCPWVADFRDPWARAPWRSARAHPLANKAAARLERWAIERAAAVIFTTEAARTEFAAQYGDTLGAKFSVVPNGCDASMFDGIPDRESDRFLLLHAGSLYGGRDPRPLFHAIRSGVAAGRLDRNAFQLQLLGATALDDTDLHRAVREMELGDVVELLPRADHRASLHAMKGASGLLLMQQGTTMSVPAKLYEYMAAGKRIFAICDEGETASLVRTSGAGVVVPAGDPQVLEDALVAFVNAGKIAHSRPDRALFDGAVSAARTRVIVEAVMRSRSSTDVDATAGDARSRA